MATSKSIASPTRCLISLSQTLGFVPWMTRPRKPSRSAALLRFRRMSSFVILVYRARKLSMFRGLAKT